MATIDQAKLAAAAEFLSTEELPGFRTFTVSTIPLQNVTGIGRGPKISAGVDTGKECLRFYVEWKLPRASISSSKAASTNKGSNLTQGVQG